MTYVCLCTVVPMNTLGDIDQIKPLSDFASKGVFTKELDQALWNGQIDLAVHCMKDLPTTLPAGLAMGCVLQRGNREDCVVLPQDMQTALLAQYGDPSNIDKDVLATLPANACIGTSALRRTAVMKIRYPHLRCEVIRGNVNTRLRKLDR